MLPFLPNTILRKKLTTCSGFHHIALIARISNMVKCHSRLHTTADGVVDEDLRLEKAGAGTMLDRQCTEVAPRDHPQNPRARNSHDTEVVAKAY